MTGLPGSEPAPHEMSKRILNISVILFFAAALLATAGCAARQRGEVVVIEKTRTYHTDACPKVNMAKTKIMTVAEARELHCLPCKACNPDQAF